MSGFNTTYVYLLSVSLPIAAVTAAALPYQGMSLLPRFDKFRSIPCGSITPERVQKFIANAGMGTTGLFVVIVLAPVVVQSILRWQSRRRRNEAQRLSVAVTIPLERKEEQKPPLISGENPDYHGDHDSIDLMPPLSSPLPRLSNPVRHLRIHSLGELPPPTMDDVTPLCSPRSCPASPVSQPEPPKEGSGQRRSPFNPILPGMKTSWEDGVDPVTGRKWRRRLVVYTGAFGSLKASDGASVGGDHGVLRAEENEMPLES